MEVAVKMWFLVDKNFSTTLRWFYLKVWYFVDKNVPSVVKLMVRHTDHSNNCFTLPPSTEAGEKSCVFHFIFSHLFLQKMAGNLNLILP